jgi:hypothetical protein
MVSEQMIDWTQIGLIALAAVCIPALLYGLYRAIRYLRQARYFASDGFASKKRELAEFVREHNDIAAYAAEVRRSGAFGLAVGDSTSGQYSHLASFDNTSRHNYRRDRNVADYAPQVHNCGLTVVRNASREPIKYLMKYFGVKSDEATLASVQGVGESVARLEGVIANLERREAEVASAFDPPKFILKHYSDKFYAATGVHLPGIVVPYPVYKFQYVSAAGNSSQETVVRLDTPTLEALAQTLVDKIKWRKSAAGQRALMTARLREAIKRRDGYACRSCHVSVNAEPNLLLEIDHIIPVSRGGLSVPENLQCLCWRCNRTKGAKMPT